MPKRSAARRVRSRWCRDRNGGPHIAGNRLRSGVHCRASADRAVVTPVHTNRDREAWPQFAEFSAIVFEFDAHRHALFGAGQLGGRTGNRSRSLFDHRFVHAPVGVDIGES